MADRRAELERKKLKLAMIREEKERRRREKEAREAESAAKTQKNEKDVLAETDELLSSLGISLPGAPSSLTSDSTSSLNTSLASNPSLVSHTPPKRATRKCNLTVVSVHQTNIPPKEKVSYNKQTQTLPVATDREPLPLDYYVLTYDDLSLEEDGEGSSLPSLEHPYPPPPPHHRGHKVFGLPNVEMVRPAQTTEESANVPSQDQDEKKKSYDLSDEEKMQIMRREDFHHFLDRTSRVIERALYEDVDILVDYTGTVEDQEGDDKSGMTLSLNRCFVDDHWSKNRTITSFDWSTQFPELLCASYNQNEDSPHEPDGVCLIWNMKFKKTSPEYVFHCQSAVTSACFAKYHPNLVIGGTYSGQIVLWDNRSSKRTPVQRSPLSSVAHTHPVYSIHVVGSENAHNLVTVSTDGKCCTWSVDMLSAPQDTIELNQQKQSRTVAVTCMSFPSGEFNNFVVGSEDGVVCTACRHGNRAGIIDVFESHQGPVTGIDTHKTQGQIDFSDLFITSSFDWTVKLWSLKCSQPIHSFEDSSDYIFDVSWSPIHPALFASVDGLGHLDLWNLNCDAELPTASTVIDGSPALNHVTWTPSGHNVAIGDNHGKIWLYDVGEQLANPKIDEWSRFSQTLQDLQSNQSYQNTDFGPPTPTQPLYPGGIPIR